MTGLTRRQVVGLLLLLLAAGILIVLRLLVYSDIGGTIVWGWPAPEVARFRWTAVAVASIAGAALAVSGVLLQALLRNPLASPFILGLSSGAALGVMVAIAVGAAAGLGASAAGGKEMPALLGALATLGAVYTLGQRRGWIDPLSLVLTGVIVSAICGALILFLQHLQPESRRGEIVTWMMGAIRQGTSGGSLAIAGGLTLLGAGLSVALGRAMDAATLGDEEARSVGLALGPLRLVLFLTAGLLTALAVALAGPIGFVGLIAPHAARLLLGPRHVAVILGAVLLGIALLVGGDVLAQTIRVQGGRMPIGVFTALVGGPAFIWLLRSGRGQA